MNEITYWGGGITYTPPLSNTLVKHCQHHSSLMYVLLFAKRSESHDFREL